MSETVGVDLKLVCIAGKCTAPLDLNTVATRFSFVKKDRRFGGRLCIALSGATLWIYSSGKLTVLGREIGEVEAAYGVARRRLKESGDTADVSDSTTWNVVRKIETNPRERLSLRKISSRIPGSRFERAQRTVLCHLDHGVDEVAGHSLVQIYGSGKLLIRGRHKGPLPKTIRDLIPAVKDAGQAGAGGALYRPLDHVR